MMRKKIISIAIAVVLTISLFSFTTLAASKYNSPAEAAADLSEKSPETVARERNEGNTFCSIAKQAGKIEEFKKEIMEMKRERVEARVANGTMTREQADTILERLRLRLENCDGSGAGDGTQETCGFGNGARDGSCDGTNCENGRLGVNGGLGNNGNNDGQRGSKGFGGYSADCPNN